MAKDIYDFKRQFIFAVRKRDDEKERVKREYEKELSNYILDLQKKQKQKSTVFKRILGKNSSMLKEPIKPDLSEFEKLPDISLAEIGQRFAICYGDITGPLYGLKIYRYSDDIDNILKIIRDRVDEIELNTAGILGELRFIWTVVEYMGDGKYKDLVTGEVLLVPVSTEKTVLETATQSTAEKAKQQQEFLLQNPLGIQSEEITVKEYVNDESKGHYLSEVPLTDELFPELNALTPEIKKSILEITIPRKEEIEEKLSVLKQASIVGLKKYFEKRNEEVMNQYYEDAMKRSKEMQKEEEKRNQEQKAKEIEEEFERIFAPKEKPNVKKRSLKL